MELARGQGPPTIRAGHLLAIRLALAGLVACATTAAEGSIRFICPPASRSAIQGAMDVYLTHRGIPPSLFVGQWERPAGSLLYTLRTSPGDGDTLTLQQQPELAITDEVVTLPGLHGKSRQLRTVSKKEILLALLQGGRITEFAGADCTLEALGDHVAIRQNTVAWAEQLNWQWPNGGAAQWHRKYWRNGMLRPGISLHEAVNDAFLHQEKYAFGCYTAAKLVMLQGVLDYYQRIKRDVHQLHRIEARLLADRDPLVDVEPGRMWDFEVDYDARQGKRPGKILHLEAGVATRNFVPGDWVHILNTDPGSYRKTGYEGSNPIYLGRNRFSDYYNDHDHAYSYRQKLDQVFQWRNGVFSERRDAGRIQPLSERDIERLGAVPAKGGLIPDRRIFHQLFNDTASPAL